eukprot:357202-Chlamydomonas_euryale.AAC.4
MSCWRNSPRSAVGAVSGYTKGPKALSRCLAHIKSCTHLETSEHAHCEKHDAVMVAPALAGGCP